MVVLCHDFQGSVDSFISWNSITIGLAMEGVIVLDIEHKEKALNQIFIGSQLEGVKFGISPGSLLIRFEHYTNHSPDQLWLNIESRWAVFPKETRVFPASEVKMVELSEEEKYKFTFELRRQKVKRGCAGA